MPDRVWSHRGEGRPAHSPASCVPPRLGSALSWKREILANYLDPKAPGPSFPRGWGSSLQLFAHGRGGNWDSLRPVSEPVEHRAVSPEGVSCSIETDGKPHVFLNYVSLISVYLVLGILLLVFKEQRL